MISACERIGESLSMRSGELVTCARFAERTNPGSVGRSEPMQWRRADVSVDLAT
jgi:hypothetical protein